MNYFEQKKRTGDSVIDVEKLDKLLTYLQETEDTKEQKQQAIDAFWDEEVSSDGSSLIFLREAR